MARPDSTDTMVGFADFSRVGFEHSEHLPGGRFRMDPRVIGDESVFPLDIERERLKVCRHDGWHRCLELSRGEGAYSLGELPHRLVDLVSGWGASKSPGEVAARSIQLIEVMYSSANAGGAVVTVYRGEGSEGYKRRKE